MANLLLNGQLNLAGSLKLAATGGKVKASGADALVEVGRTDTAQGTGIPVIQPPQKPIDDGTEVRVSKSFNSGVTIKVGTHDLPVVALGICVQGAHATWPGMVLPSTVNATVTINHIRINVVGDTAITLANGGTVNFNQDKSGQQ